MTGERRPTLHVIAGPNGAGKTTLYRNRLEKRFPDAEFVNADELAQKEFGHPANTVAESARGQELAEQRRRELMAARKSLVTESTFSHPSKVDLVREAKQAGYQVVLYHVNVRSANLSVLRVSHRVDNGGHPVPEEKIRQRYDRNQPLIREAALIADRAYIFDNSAMGKPHQLTAVLERGKAVRVDGNVPMWARELYKKEFQAFSQSHQHRSAHSFEEARQIAQQQLGATSRTYIPRAGGRYTGEIIGQTDLHAVQQIGRHSAVAHFRAKLDRSVKVGDVVEVYYRDKAGAKVRTEQEINEAKRKADTFRKAPPQEGVKAYPDLAPAYAFVKAVEARLKGERPAEAARVAAKAREDLAGRMERGEAVPELKRRAAERDNDQDRGR